MNKALVVIFTTIGLDAVGIGLIFPILPRLIAEVTHAGNVATYIGIMTSLYAAMQFICAPVLGALSDRLGRRPVLLISMTGAAVNYLILAFAPHLWMLLIGRAVAGLTSANISVASAYITDISAEETRARRFGLFNATFGIGFIVGPVLGGILGDYWLRLPFIAAAVFNASNLLLALLVLPESRKPSRERIDLAALNPLRPFRWLISMRGLLPIITVFFIFSGVGEVYGTCWALWGHDVFGWNGLWIGLSLGTYGACQALAQMFLPGPAVKLLGERATILTGLAGTSLALAVMAFTTQAWIVFAVMPVFVLGGIGVPSLQSMATRMVSGEQQGQFQGLLASVVSLSSIVAPLGFSSFYFVVQQQWPGAIWLSAIAVYAITVPIVLALNIPRMKTAEAV
ncbi:TCR/Tet family MFS transporter [Rhizobium sp. BE258]|uniref:TCR/Tet family MFS transporter n=2 Tax=Bacteria TaxID=2 RepID=UPI00285EC48A|nr:TCR/Tet family MFS transporter [Rhizobium sp. BE258]MDR7146764.1 DHA1 family tetracycline resistance protein-like MFS transporter [Rhizobium sp. BE258]